MDEQHRALSKHRFAQAERSLASAKLLIANGDFEGAANRTYYAVFHALRSVLALDKKDFSKHAGVISYFRREYIKSGIFPVEASVIIGDAFDIRSDSDYDDYYEVTEEEIRSLLDSVETLLGWIETYLCERW
ncbi:MAG: HEPN domain-containing protein [Phascolarctobacterium sp.]|uniref:HEPN domain-containing protein n=1 Tax=Phascolarctobacterium sp. TaxID=2049039 RepID=UPI0026DDCC82|nr:HEPN domain-containing protein [Phascolarctobacterium sp.]MDO4920457.1 HEPN domain-containing protein [Phascolarctobacterium sp.]